MKRLEIPDYEKVKGMIWVEYPTCEATPGDHLSEYYKTTAIVELQIRQGVN